MWSGKETRQYCLIEVKSLCFGVSSEFLLLSCVSVAQLCPTLCNPVDCSPPGSSVHETLQARLLEWIAISFCRRSFQPRDQTQVSHIGGRFSTIWATGFPTFLISCLPICKQNVQWVGTRFCSWIAEVWILFLYYQPCDIVTNPGSWTLYAAEIGKRPDKKFRQGFTGSPAIARGRRIK